MSESKKSGCGCGERGQRTLEPRSGAGGTREQLVSREIVPRIPGLERPRGRHNGEGCEAGTHSPP